MALWLSLLFSTIGIAASDFLCINLSTLASILGLSESLTGVTFLAFGNGSPDVFSTFAAMRSNSGSLAIGELIGAACFITSVVAGSMALVRPFRVARRSFVRDVAYFIVAGSVSMALLLDGVFHVWKCLVMIGLYLFYVVMVVTWHWYLTSRRRTYDREFVARAHFHIPNQQELDLREADPDDEHAIGSETPTTSMHGPSDEDLTALEQNRRRGWNADLNDDDEEDDEARGQYLAVSGGMHISPNTRRKHSSATPIRPSLIGALEFQAVLSSLQKSRNHVAGPIGLSHYTDEPSSMHYSPEGIHSTTSHSPENIRPSGGISRYRSVSMNDIPLSHPLGAEPMLLDLDTIETTRHSESEQSSQDIGTFIDSPTITMSPVSIGYEAPDENPMTQEGDRSHRQLVTSTDYLKPSNYHVKPVYSTRSSRGIALANAVPIPKISVTAEPGGEPESPIMPFPSLSETSNSLPSRAPSLNLPSAALSSNALGVADSFIEDSEEELKAVKWWPHRFLPPPWVLISTLFPTLYNWRMKRLWEKCLGIVACPSVLLLTITIPLVDPRQNDSESESDASLESSGEQEQFRPIVRLPEDSPTVVANDHPSDHSDIHRNGNVSHINGAFVSERPTPRPLRLDSEIPAAQREVRKTTPVRTWHWWLISIQMFTAPWFVVLVVWHNLDTSRPTHSLIILSLSSLVFSLICLAALHLSIRGHTYTQPPNHLRPFLSLLGFLVGICWVATIADEVVSVLKSIGVILNISDSLLGLTIFAVGNSLGDLVADITVARLGYPVMALSACFGGPMLNILLGVGIGGLYMTLHYPNTGKLGHTAFAGAKETYEISISKTLVISGFTMLVILIGLLIIIPLNGWMMDRKIGFGLIALWTASTVGNVIAEIVT